MSTLTYANRKEVHVYVYMSISKVYLKQSLTSSIDSESDYEPEGCRFESYCG